MVVLSRSIALAFLASVVAQLQTGCAPGMTRPGPREDAAEIVLPPSFSPGGLDRIRNDLLQFVAGAPHSHIRPGKCKRCVVDVAIHSIGLTTDIVPVAGPARFRIIGWTKNTDKADTENEYSLKPGVEYLIWVAPAPLNPAGTSKTQWGFLELSAGSTGPIVPVTIGYVTRCPHQNPPGNWKSDTDFKECDEAYAAGRVGTGPGPRPPALFGTSNESKPRLTFAGRTWFDCGGYCCTTAE